MPITTQKFKWIDRDTVARNMLQLVYFAPPSISMMATRLIIYLRSPQLIPELIEIVQDDSIHYQQRLWCLSALQSMRVEVTTPEFSDLLVYALSCDTGVPFSIAYAIRDFVCWKETNQEWYFNVLDQLPNTDILAQFLYLSPRDVLIQPDTRRETFIRRHNKRLMELLDNRIDLFSPAIVSQLLVAEDDHESEMWLDKHIELCSTMLQEAFNCSSNGVVNQHINRWKRLREYFVDNAVHSWQSGQSRIDEYRKDNRYLLSPVYQYLHQLYRQALNGDEKSQHDLYQVASRYQGNINLQAVAVHFLARLPDNPDAIRKFQIQVEQGVDDSWCEIYDRPLVEKIFPVRWEAGNAIYRLGTPEAWEILVNAYFSRPRCEFSRRILPRIGHLTDFLSGDSDRHPNEQAFSTQYPWFRQLQELSLDSLPS